MPDLADLLGAGFNVAGSYSNGDFVELSGKKGRKVFLYTPENIVLENPDDTIVQLIKNGDANVRLKDRKLVFKTDKEAYSYDPETKITAKLNVPCKIQPEKTIGYGD